MYRRRFVEITGALAAGAMLPLAAANVPDIKFPSNPRERLAVAVGRLGGSFYNPDAEVRAKVVANAKLWVDVAAAIGSPGIRTHIAGASTPPDVDLSAESLSRRCCNVGLLNGNLIEIRP